MNLKRLKTAAAVMALASLPAVLAAQPMKDDCPLGMGPGMGGGMMGMMGPGMGMGMGPGMGMGMGGGMMGMMGGDIESRPLITHMLREKERLELSAEQVGRLNELRTGFEKEAIKSHGEMQVLGVDMANLLGSEKVDMAKVEEVVRKQEAVHTAMRLSRLKTLEAGKAVLTPDQQAKFRQLLEEAPPMLGPGKKRPGMAPDRMRRGPAVAPAPAEKEAAPAKPM